MQTATVGTPWGPVTYLPHDKYIGAGLTKYREFSMGEASLFQKIVPSASDVIEAGANIGCHTICLAQLTLGRVWALEPQANLFTLLEQNTARHRNVAPMKVAAGAEWGVGYLPSLDWETPQSFGSAHLKGSPEGWGGHAVPIDVMPLDHLGSRCGFLKIDVEGMELEALLGAQGTIERHRPRIYLENDRADRSERLIGLLREWGYDLYWHLPPLFNPSNLAGDEENIFPDVVSVNLLAVHETDPMDEDVLLDDPHCFGEVMGTDDTHEAARERVISEARSLLGAA